MKDSKEYSKKVHKLYRSLKHKYPKPQKTTYDEPVGAIVYAIVSENISETAARSAIKRFTDYFVDWNDLRVSRAEEIVELLREDTPVTRDIASALTTTLRAVFDEYHTNGRYQPVRGQLLHANGVAGSCHTAYKKDDRVSKKQPDGSS